MRIALGPSGVTVFNLFDQGRDSFLKGKVMLKVSLLTCLLRSVLTQRSITFPRAIPTLTLPSIDVLTDNNDPSPSLTSAYSKKTFTGLLTNYFSFTPYLFTDWVSLRLSLIECTRLITPGQGFTRTLASLQAGVVKSLPSFFISTHFVLYKNLVYPAYAEF